MYEPKMRFANEEELRSYNHINNTNLKNDQVAALCLYVQNVPSETYEVILKREKARYHDTDFEFKIGKQKLVLAEFSEIPCWTRLTYPLGSDKPSLIKLLHPVARRQ